MTLPNVPLVPGFAIHTICCLALTVVFPFVRVPTRLERESTPTLSGRKSASDPSLASWGEIRGNRSSIVDQASTICDAGEQYTTIRAQCHSKHTPSLEGAHCVRLHDKVVLRVGGLRLQTASLFFWWLKLRCWK